MRAVSSSYQKIRSEKIVLIGAASSGKTSLVNRFINDKFNATSEATIGAAFMNKTIKVDGTDIKLEIWDTGGSEKYRSLAPMYYRDARAAVVVFDVTSTASFTEALEWITEFREKSQTGSIVVAAANKCDLESERKVTFEEAQDFAFSNQLELIKETSALSGYNVTDLFQELGKQLLLLAPQSNGDDIEIADIAQPPQEAKKECC
ncbi:Ras-related protein Rab-5A [Tritrichomonas foetus]|uniref:Ras-related protein Rab-5A n=1 Tax=Tritrichomonas foetus TaxID=1144522 RepID=A0A1J4KB40_9EUKA|nr:Ras-related protein Rab-5A [Tritrichomonas foetus]|eukprot:OHT06685.1 Ras-related protein Rab-5A [Tritrichomonas foetus]